MSNRKPQGTDCPLSKYSLQMCGDMNLIHRANAKNKPTKLACGHGCVISELRRKMQKDPGDSQNLSHLGLERDPILKNKIEFD